MQSRGPGISVPESGPCRAVSSPSEIPLRLTYPSDHGPGICLHVFPADRRGVLAWGQCEGEGERLPGGVMLCLDRCREGCGPERAIESRPDKVGAEKKSSGETPSSSRTAAMVSSSGPAVPDRRGAPGIQIATLHLSRLTSISARCWLAAVTRSSLPLGKRRRSPGNGSPGDRPSSTRCESATLKR